MHLAKGFSNRDGQTSNYMEIFRPCNQGKFPVQTFGLEDSHARTYPWQTKVNEKVYKEKGQGCFMHLHNSSKRGVLRGSFLKMFPGYSTATVAKISERSSIAWMNSGMAFRGECWTLNTLEHHSDDDVSTLSQVVVRSAPLKYFLNQAQLQKWLKRAKTKKLLLPTDLSKALELQASTQFSTPLLGDSRAQGRKAKDSGTTAKPTRLTQEEARTLFVRRLLPSEYEKLQGFPENWTATDIEL